ncbi:MAG: hypothetical protein ACUVYA_07310 [Planctomycetota bacterium]
MVPSPSVLPCGGLQPETEKRLGAYSPAEQKAILDHRFFLSIELARQATIEETLASWESHVSREWRREKSCRDRMAQFKEIERHKYYLSLQSGHDIGWDLATLDWVRNHAAAWREWWELHWWEKQWWEQ